MQRFSLIASFLLLLQLGTAQAQSLREALLTATKLAPDLELPTEPSYLGAFSAPKLALYRPDGAGPFPALVLLHQCSGLRSANGGWQNMSVLGWAKEAVSRGYVALVLDSLGPRSVDSVCMSDKGGVNFPRGVRDAHQAAQHLRTLPYVDPNRIGFAGFSWGAMVGLLSGGESWGSAMSAGTRFSAIVAFYPGCFEIRAPSGRSFPIVNMDIEVPTLVLMGDQDTETPSAECTSRLKLVEASGGPVEWHVYPGMTHCWDCQNLNGLRKTDWRGTAVEYRYNHEASKDSADRMFVFFEKAFGRTR